MKTESTKAVGLMMLGLTIGALLLLRQIIDSKEQAKVKPSPAPVAVSDANTNHRLAVEIKKPWCWAIAYSDQMGNETIVKHVIYDSPQLTIPIPSTKPDHIAGVRMYLVNCADWHIKVDGSWEPKTNGN